jgi:hypothetical protein
MQILKIRAKYEAKLSLYNRLNLETQKYKNERFVEADIADNAKLFIHILSMYFKLENNFQKIFIRMQIKNETKQTSIASKNKEYLWNEQFNL